MNDNIAYLYKLLLEKYKCNDNEKLSLFINYLACYTKDKNTNDKFFLSLLNLTLFKNLINRQKYDYKKYLNQKNLTETQNIICLDNSLYILDNILDDILIDNKNNDKYIHIHEPLNFFYILNNVLNNKSLNLTFLKNKSYKKPINIINIYSEYFINTMANSNIYIDILENSSVDIIETYINLSKNSFINRCIVINLHDNTNVSYHTFNYANNPLLDTSNIYVFQKRGSKLDFYKKYYGKQVYKGVLNFFLHEENTLLNLKSLNKFENYSVYDLKCNINHYSTNSKSYTLFRSVNDSNSKTIFRSNLNIGLDINNVDAKLYCNSLMLTDTNDVTFIPKLNIGNNDIKAAHGATIGKIDEKILLYIISRGISRQNAISILIKSFLSNDIKNENFSAYILNKQIIK